MARKPPKNWTCPQGHILGLVVINGSNVRRLTLYRQALRPDDDQEPEILCTLTGLGGADDVECSICRQKRSYDPDAEAMRRLIRSIKRRRKNR